MRVLSGTYAGNGVDNRPIFVGFAPDIVIVDRSQVADAAPNEAVMRTSTMVGDVSKDMDGPNAVAANKIQSLTFTGFTIGTDATVNEAGGTYHWVAFRGAPGQLRVGSYAGDGVTDNRSITGVGFQPDYVIVLPESAARAVHRSSAMPGDVTYQFSTVNFPDGIQALQSDGFQVGLDPRVNAAATNYYFAAWKATPGRVAVGVYAGTGVDNLNITGTGFMPEEVIVQRSTVSFRTVHKPASTGVATDLSLLFESRIGEADSIQALQVNGFQVGLNSRVNAATNYYWMAFGPHTPQTDYRSIGTAANDTTGTLTATNSSVDVTGAGTLWKTKNRGRGDVITICDDVPTCLTNVNYVVAAVNSDTSLRLTTPYTGAGGAGKTFAVKRQFATLQAWEDCISFGGACPFFPVISASLVADDRNEVGIAYKDSVFTAPLDDRRLHDRRHAHDHAHGRRRQPQLRPSRDGRPDQQRRGRRECDRRPGQLRDRGVDGDHERRRPDLRGRDPGAVHRGRSRDAGRAAEQPDPQRQGVRPRELRRRRARRHLQQHHPQRHAVRRMDQPAISCRQAVASGS